MTDTPDGQLPSLAGLRDLVVGVSEGVSALQGGGTAVSEKIDGSYVTAVDQDLQDRLLRALDTRWPG